MKKNARQIGYWALAISLLPWTLSFAVAAVPDGYVVKVDSPAVYLDWGKASGAAAGDSFSVYRPGEPLKHPVTGEVLGQTEVDLGKGVLERVEEKFSTGKLIESVGEIKAGDRTRYVESAAPVLSTGATVLVTLMPKELWRSPAMDHQATGLAIGDIAGDGKKEVVVSFKDQIDVFRWNGKQLEPLAVFKSRGYDNYMAVDVGDIDGAGHDKIFASLYINSVKRSRTLILEYAQGALHEVGHMDGFVRAFEPAVPDGKRVLLWQDMSLSRELRIKQPAPLTKTAKGFREGSPLKLSRSLSDDQLFGYAWGDWDGDGVQDFALLQNGERLRVFLKDAKWGSNDVYGGTHADFSWEGEQMGSIFPRLLTLQTSSGKSQLLVPHNIQFTPIRLARLKIFKNAELVDLAWNGLEMAPLWTLPISGELADFGVGDAQASGTPQLWIAAVGAGDKTVLLAYQIP